MSWAGRLGLVVGDATGKGVPAALGDVHYLRPARAVLKPQTTRGEVLQRVNEALSTHPGQYVRHLFLPGVLDPRGSSFALIPTRAAELIPYVPAWVAMPRLMAGGCPWDSCPAGYEEKEISWELAAKPSFTVTGWSGPII